MVTYGFYAVFAALGTYNAFQGRPFVALFYAVALGFMIWFDRKMARDSKAHEARMKASAEEHDRLMKKLDESAKRYAAEAAQAVAERKAYLDAHYFAQIVLVRAEVEPMTEEIAARIRQEFQYAAEQTIANLS
jgi:hypothetical protein